MTLTANEQKVFDAISDAAHAGARCPSNAALSRMLGHEMETESYISKIFGRLIRKKRISVERRPRGRVVTILRHDGSDGVSTADLPPALRTSPVIPTIAQARAEMPRVDRDPCPKCAVRGDIGCVHRRRLYKEAA